MLSPRALLARIWPLPVLMPLVVGVAMLAWQGTISVRLAVVTMLMNLVLVVGLYMFVGVSGVFSFGQMAFMAIGAYTAGLVRIPDETKTLVLPDLPGFIARAEYGPLVATLLGGAAAAALAIIVAIPLMRMRELSIALGTFVVLIIVNVVAEAADFLTHGPAGLAGIPITTTRDNALVWALIAILAAHLFQRSKTGLRLRSSRDDEVAARSVGVNVPGQRFVAFVVSGFFVGIGGALYAQYLGAVTPDLFYLGITFTTLAMLVVGGRTSLSGAVVGTIAISALTELLRHAERGFDIGIANVPGRIGMTEAGLAVALLVVLIWRPAGVTNGREIPFPYKTSPLGGRGP
jgi:branched-chain amino acid transport system permease protein